MSHPNPSHDRDNEYPSDDYSPRSKALKNRVSKRKKTMGDKLIRFSKSALHNLGKDKNKDF